MSFVAPLRSRLLKWYDAHARTLPWRAPIFIDIMMEHPVHDWGRPSYPVVD